MGLLSILYVFLVNTGSRRLDSSSLLMEADRDGRYITTAEVQTVVTLPD